MAKKQTKSKKNVSTTASKPKEALQAESSVLEGNPDAEVVEVEKKELVKVRAIIPFYDLEANMSRGAGAEWEVSEDRAELLKKLGIAIVL